MQNTELKIRLTRLGRELAAARDNEDEHAEVLALRELLDIVCSRLGVLLPALRRAKRR